MAENTPQVAVIMGSSSDWETMSHACDILEKFHVPYEKQVISAHRTPELMADFAHNARSRGIKVIIAGAGGAAHLPGMTAAQTTLPVIGVPVKSRALNGAWRNSCGNNSYWKFWCNQCRVISCEHFVYQ